MRVWYHSVARRQFWLKANSLPLWWKLWCAACSPRLYLKAVAASKAAIANKDSSWLFDAYVMESDELWARILDLPLPLARS